MKAKSVSDHNSYAYRDRDRAVGIGGGGMGAGGGNIVSNVDTSRGNRNPNQYESIVTRYNTHVFHFISSNFILILIIT